MSLLTKMRIDDFATMKYGKMPPKNVVSDEGYPIYSGYRVTGFAKEFLYKKPELIVVARGVGGTGDVKISPPEAWITNLSIVLSLSPEIVDKKFLYYCLGREPLKERLNTGAAQAQITIANLQSYEVELPDLTSQKRIASILSAYDDLIENNRRRIVLLEEAARLLYREWFVHFRFPGHEHIKIIDGVPEGWGTAKVDGAVKRHPPGKLYSQKTALKSGKIPILDQGQSGLIGYHNNEPSFRADIDEPVITFANHTCYQRIIHFSFSAIQNVLPFKPSNSVPSEIYWLHHATEGLVKLNAYKGHWPEFMTKEFTVPTDDVARDFSEIVRPMHLQSHKLQIQNEQLTKARDLLLPRLMDGRLEV